MRDIIEKLVHRIIYLKIEANKLEKQKTKAFQDYRKLLGVYQELQRKINENLNELTKYKNE